MRKPKKEIHLTSYEELLGIEDNQENSVDKITEIPIDCLYGFKNHPFHVINDEKMQETVDSIKEYGVLNPCIVRPREGGGYGKKLKEVPKCMGIAIKWNSLLVMR